LGKGRSHTDSDQASMGAVEPLEYPFWLKIRSQRWLSESFKDLMIALFINCLSLLYNTLTVEKTN